MQLLGRWEEPPARTGRRFGALGRLRGEDALCLERTSSDRMSSSSETFVLKMLGSRPAWNPLAVVTASVRFIRIHGPRLGPE